jgi:phosphoglycolate phosphatase-like HAD superfamily hydrolase
MLIVFDWGGTRCDSAGRIASAMRAAADEPGLSLPAPAAVRQVALLPLPVGVASR